MAIYHLSMKAIARSSGRSATGAAAYRAGCRIVDERTGEIHDYRRKGGVESADLILPDGVPPMDRAEFWNLVERHHRRGDAVVAREVEIALPAELPPEARRQLALDFARELADHYGVAADVCVHRPGKGGDERNHHAHILLSACGVGPDGLGKKVAVLDPIHCQRHQMPNPADLWRARWAELVNERLKQHQVDARVDHRSLKAQGIDREPTKHLGPAATGFERRTGRSAHKRMTHALQTQRERQERHAEVVRQKVAHGLGEYERAEARYRRVVERTRGPRNAIIATQVVVLADRKLHKWGGSGPSAGKVAIIERGNMLTAAGRYSSPKVQLMAQIAHQKGWKAVTVTGDDEFKRLAVAELTRRGIKVLNPELQHLVQQAAQAPSRQPERQVPRRSKRSDPIQPAQAEAPPQVDEKRAAYDALVQTWNERGKTIDAKDGGMYIGVVVEVSPCGRYAVQHLGRGMYCVHDLAKVDGQLAPGQMAEVRYRDGRGINISRGRQRDKGIER